MVQSLKNDYGIAKHGRRNPLAMLAWVGALAVVALPAKAEAKPISLNCNIEEGASVADKYTQITIDEDAGTVIYNSHLTGPDPIKEYQVKGPIPKEIKIDVSMKITANNEKFIYANDKQSVFILTKHDGQFAYSFVTAVPVSEGNFLAFGNTHSGTCVNSLFD
jgi:hypothetical protein